MRYFQEIARLVDRKTLLLLLISAFATSVLEVASVSIVIPALNVILTDRIPAFVNPLLRSLGIESAGTQKLMLLLVIAAAFAMRALALSMILLLQSRLIFSVQAKLSEILYRAYLLSRFEDVGRISTTSITRASTTELSNVTLGVLLPMALLCSELALVLGALLVLVAMQPAAAAVLLLITALVSMPVFMLNRKQLSRLGNQRHVMEDDRTRFAQEVTGGVREVKVYGMEPQLLTAIGGISTSYGRVMTRINFLQNFPRIYFEAAGLCALLAICGVQLYREIPPSEILTFLVLAGFVAFRALPSVAKILSQLQSIRFYRPSILNFISLIEELGETPEHLRETATPPPPPEPPGLPSRVRIEARNASYRHDLASHHVFRDASFTLESGQFIGLVGPSGIGKSTLLDCIIGLRQLDEGSITALDESTGNDAALRVAYVPQTPVVFDASIWRNLSLAQSEPSVRPFATPAMEQALHITGFAQLMASRGLDLSSRITESGRNLSGGQRQRLALTRALIRGGNVLVLDEATSALDEASERQIYEAIRMNARNAIVILVTHRPQLLSLCDQILEIHPGGKLHVESQRAQAGLL